MSDVQTVVPIPDLEPADLPISGTDLVIIGQGGLAKRTTVDDVFGAGVPNPMPAVDGSAVQVTATGSTTAIDLADRAAQVISVKDYGAKGDLILITGTIIYSGTLVTIPDAHFAATDVGKTIILPAGGTSGAPVLTTITSFVDANTVHVAAAAAAAFSGVTSQLNSLTNAPSDVTVGNAGTGYKVGDVLAVTGGTAARAGSLIVMVTKALTATANNAGTIGPTGPVTLTGTTGYGRRVQATGTVVAGSLSGALTITDAGGMWSDVTNAAAEPMTAYPLAHTTTATFSNASNTVIVASASGMVVGNPIAATGIPNGTTITVISGTTLTISDATTAAGTAVSCTVTNNSLPIYTTATFASGSTSVTVASATGLSIGQAISAPGIPGNGNPTVSTNTTITNIVGTTLTISAATTAEAVQPVVFIAFPMLTGVTLTLTYGVSVAAVSDPGAYSALPSFPCAVSGGTGTGATFTPPTSAIRVPCGTDDTDAINSAYAAALALAGTAFPDEGEAQLVWPAAAYLATGSINACNIKTQGFTIEGNGALLYSAASGLIAYSAFNTRYTTMSSPLQIVGDQSFPPKVGFAAGNIGSGVADSLSYEGLRAFGTFTLASGYLIATEGSTFSNARFWNKQPTGFSGGNPVLGSYGLIVDGLNHFGVSSPFAPQTRTANTANSFNGLVLPNIDIRHSGAGSALWVDDTSDLIMQGYMVSYGPPATWLYSSTAGGAGASARAQFKVHSETTLQQDVFFVTGANVSMIVQGFDYDDASPNAKNSLVALDSAGTFGAAAAALSLFGSNISVAGMQTGARVFDRPSLTFYQGNVAIIGSTSVAAWNIPTFFEGSVSLERRLTYHGEGAFFGAGGIGCSGPVTFTDDFTVGGNITSAGPVLIGLPNGTPSAALGGDNVNGSLTLGKRGTGGAPGASNPSVQFFGPSNTGTADGVMRVTASGVLTINGVTRVDVTAPYKMTSTVGFNNTAPISKPTVSGSKGSNAALTSLMTALSNYGLVTDSTS